jgi:outer membrane cobalamin receptor
MLFPVARAPRLVDLYYPDSGNPSIQPEQKVGHVTAHWLEGSWNDHVCTTDVRASVMAHNPIDLVRRATASRRRGTSARKSTFWSTRTMKRPTRINRRDAVHMSRSARSSSDARAALTTRVSAPG